jgi:hypothetical protein
MHQRKFTAACHRNAVEQKTKLSILPMSTASEILDELSPGDSSEMLVIDCIAFTICPECGHVDAEEETLMNHPCQTCGKNIHIRQILFSSEERIVEMIFDCYRSAKAKELCVLLFCTLIEHQLRNLIVSRCVRVDVNWVVIDLLLEKYWRVDERLKLFDRITGTSIKSVVAALPGKNVFDAYSTLRKKRDGLAHGLPAAAYAVTSADVRTAVDEAANPFSTFAHLHHAFCAVDAPPLPPS